jgi:hypothetical protein
MSALDLLNVTPQCSTYTMFVMFTDELFLGFETVCSTHEGLWYLQEELGYCARMLHNKYLCSRHFSEGDFTTAEKVHLNREAVPCGSDSNAQSLPQPREP